MEHDNSLSSDLRYCTTQSWHTAFVGLTSRIVNLLWPRGLLVDEDLCFVSLLKSEPRQIEPMTVFNGCAVQ